MQSDLTIGPSSSLKDAIDPAQGLPAALESVAEISVPKIPYGLKIEPRIAGQCAQCESELARSAVQITINEYRLEARPGAEPKILPAASAAAVRGTYIVCRNCGLEHNNKLLKARY